MSDQEQGKQPPEYCHDCGREILPTDTPICASCMAFRLSEKGYIVTLKAEQPEPTERKKGDWYAAMNRYNQAVVYEVGRPFSKAAYEEGPDGEVCRGSFLADAQMIVADHELAERCRREHQAGTWSPSPHGPRLREHQG